MSKSVFNRPVIMTGIGNIKFIDLVKKIGTDQELDILNLKLNFGSLANYRELDKATQEEIDAFFMVTAWLKEKMINDANGV